MTTNPATLVSIIMPAYNAALYIGVAVDSVLAQTWTAWELLIIDDGSQDGTPAYLDTLHDPRIRLLRQDHQGVSRARNRGLDAARGEFVTFLDADDALPAGSIECRARYLLEHPEVALAGGPMSYRDQTLTREERRFVPDFQGDFWSDAIRLNQGVVKFTTYLYRQELLATVRFNEHLTHCEDLLFFIQLASQRVLMPGFVNQVIYLYRIGHASASQDSAALTTGYQGLIREVSQLPGVSRADIAFLRLKVGWALTRHWAGERKYGHALTAATSSLLPGGSLPPQLWRAWLFALMQGSGSARLFRQLRIRNREIAILTFHRISDEKDDLWPPMPVKVFEQLMAFLAREAVVLPLHDLTQIERYPNKPLVCLSFDDGYLDFHDNALPILKRFGLPVHHNICPGLIDCGAIAWTQVLSRYLRGNAGKTLKMPDGFLFQIPAALRERDFLRVLARMYEIDHQQRVDFIDQLANTLDDSRFPELMDWDQIRACQVAGVTFGSHGMWHSHLPTIEDESLLREEINGSRRRMHEELGVAPSIFAMPSGFYDARCLDLVAEAGYRFALLCEDQVVRHPLPRNGSLLTLPRINMANATLPEERLRALGCHQKVKFLLQGRPFLMPAKP